MSDNITPRLSDLSRSYGTNWTKTNISTLFDWINISAFNIRCLELCINKYRKLLRYQMILNLVLSTSSGTLSVSQFNMSESQQINIAIKILFITFSFAIAISAGALKIYQIQERLESAIKIKQEWTVFSTAIASELQLPIELRHDALYTIDKNKSKYLDLLKSDCDISESIKKHVAAELPHSSTVSYDLISLPRIMIDICTAEMNDFKSANVKNRDRFSRPVSRAQTASAPPSRSDDIPANIVLNMTSPPLALPTSPVRDDSPPAPQLSYSAP